MAATTVEDLPLELLSTIVGAVKQLAALLSLPRVTRRFKAACKAAVVAVNPRGDGVGPEMLEYLRQSYRGFSAADLDDCEHVDLGALAGPTLWWLSIDGCGAKSVAPLSACPLLEHLCIAMTSVDDLAPLNSLAALRFLDVGGLELCSLNLTLPSLTTLAVDGLTVAGQPLDDNGIATIATGCPSLRTISAEDCPGVGDEGIAALAACRQLIAAAFTACERVTGATIAALATAITLDMAGCSITDDAAQHFARLRCLRFLSLDNTHVSDAFVACLAEANPALEGLAVSDTEVGDLGVSALAACKRLKHLSIANAGIITDTAARAVAGLPLIYLNVAGADITAAALGHLSLTNLSVCILDACDEITPEDKARFLERRPGCRITHAPL